MRRPPPLLQCIALALLGATRLAEAQRAPAWCARPDTAGVEIRFLDVGQGDAALIVTSDGRRALIDGGPDGDLLDAYLTRDRIDRLDLVIASHHHLDHIGGLPAVLASRAVTNVVENGMPATTRIYGRLVDAMARRGSRVLAATPRELTLGTAMFRILPPWSAAEDQNDASVGVIVSHGAFRALFTGDAETRAVDAWIRDGRIPRVQVAKAGHHGSRNGVTPALVRAAAPSLLVISVGEDNRYGHPHPEALAAWRAPTRRILRTDLEGTIRVRGCADGRYFTTTAREGGR
ncbi:MAG: MBL fold metallo-hydrolase [Gemmatimonadetes bacterium]|nr:MBL fold metallo-hydrolase [Gemmatimonadota bacterium]